MDENVGIHFLYRNVCVPVGDTEVGDNAAQRTDTLEKSPVTNSRGGW